MKGARGAEGAESRAIAVVIPSGLRPLAGGAERALVAAHNVGGVLRELERRFPGFAAELGGSFAVAIDGELHPGAAQQPVAAGSELHFLPPISGGAGAAQAAAGGRVFAVPHSIAEAVALLESHGANARVLAGGTDLLVQMRSGLRPAVLVDVKRIPELQALRFEKEECVIGAAHSAAALREHPDLRERWPGVVEAAELIGSEQIQGRASLGGNLCNASPAADTVPALVAAAARCEIAGPGGRRFVAAEDFCLGPGENALAPGELLVALRLPLPAPRSADAYLRLIPRSEMDIAVAGAGVSLALDAQGRIAAARIALGAVAPRVLLLEELGRALVGAAPDEAALARVAEAARAAVRPIDDKRGTVEYRRHVAGVLARRALAIAARRAAAKGG
ncbi:MAG: FAD binding domain-containing protein [Deltaproteobacteria bacterium]|nr:FAD binding domain-containing protein [Deltaproteobacteria bacterium]